MHVDSIMDLLMFLSFYRMILKPGTVRNLLPFAAIVGLLIGAADWWLLAGPYVQPSFARTSHLLLIAPLPLVFFSNCFRILRWKICARIRYSGSIPQRYLNTSDYWR